VRVRERVEGLAGVWATTWRVTRTSNAYDFPAIAKATRPTGATKGQNSRGTQFPDLPFLNPSLLASLERLKSGVFGSKVGATMA